jgi:hypothetical protein
MSALITWFRSRRKPKRGGSLPWWVSLELLGVSLQLAETASGRQRAVVEMHHATAETAFVHQL